MHSSNTVIGDAFLSTETSKPNRDNCSNERAQVNIYRYLVLCRTTKLAITNIKNIVRTPEEHNRQLNHI